MMSLLQLPSKHLAEVLSSVAEIRMAVICLLEKIRVLDKLHSGMSYSVPFPPQVSHLISLVAQILENLPAMQEI